ncbi:molybdenum cofactor biosynthesis protein A [Sulfobacillus acidophilus TPY]|uniref:GTP 3',8-cyclase n=1 Tax=Sulfobacillus acidophilus (strain ATCC 700253 / DSM 10332 / NAL) TaxID=679936 RepID=G8TZN9_SULAD|nr:molybdenum cofactor biosynthesis protein A [Sulfobacillus acidophilus TPY]AEW06369.1 GTP cyclohydrolase subunit MoaA [Sulfobacillus acidophilus DSM 10332]
MNDRYQRPLHDLRISVIDRCNFRCVYCMPKEVYGQAFQFLPRAELLTFEEITRIATVFARLGVKKIRLTGGEPLIRRDIEHLVAQLAAIPGIDDIAMTTNGSLLTLEKATQLRAAGLKRITVSLDALDETIFQAINDVGYPAARVLQAIDHAAAAGLNPVKVNMVVKRGVNESQIIPMAEYFRGTGHVLRFIEYMDVGTLNGWRLDDVVSAEEILTVIDRQFPLEPLPPRQPGEVARRFRYRDGRGEIGLIASVTQPFCRHCNRARLAADGQLYTCLFNGTGHDLKALVRSGASDEELADTIRQIWTVRQDRYSELRTQETRNLPKVEMFRMGG